MGGTRVEKQSLACSTNVFICSPLVSQELHCSQFESARGIRFLTFVFAWGPVCFPLVSEDLYCSRFKSPPGICMGGWAPGVQSDPPPDSPRRWGWVVLCVL